MNTNLEQLKLEYLNEFNRSIPRLKKMATELRQQILNFEENEEIDEFWRITDNPKTNYELSQLAENLDWYDDFWQTHPLNPKRETPPAETAIATNRLIDMRDHNRDAMEFLAEAEAILTLVMETLDSGDTPDENKRLSIKAAVGKIVNAANTLDTCLDFPLCRALGK